MDLNNLDSTNSKSYIQLEGRHVRKNKSSGFRILPTNVFFGVILGIYVVKFQGGKIPSSSWVVERFSPFENYDPMIVSQNG